MALYNAGGLGMIFSLCYCANVFACGRERVNKKKEANYLTREFKALPCNYWGMLLLYDFISTVLALHYGAVIMGAIASQVTSLAIVYSAFYSGADQRKYQSSVSLVFVRGIHRGPVNYPHKWPLTRKMLPFRVQTHKTKIESQLV